MSNIIIEILNDDFKLHVTDELGEAFIHCTVSSWKLSTYKNIIGSVAYMLDEAKALGYDGVYTYTTNPKFAKLFGFSDEIKSIESEGQIYEVLGWQ